MVTEKTLDNLEAGDVVLNKDGYKYLVVSAQGEYVIVSSNQTQPNGNGVFVYTTSYFKDRDFTVLKPLGTAEKAAKFLLESIGFKVTR